jgi:NADH dehydrogenase
LVEAGAELALGDLKDKESLYPACKGVGTVITTANSMQRGGADNPQTVDLEGNLNLVDAARAAGVKHFVFVSMNIADPKSPVPFAQAKGRAEEYLRSSNIPYTIVAPNAFMEVWFGLAVCKPAMEGLPVTLVGSGKRKHSFISAVDVAEFVIGSVDNPRAINRRLLLGGPEPVSFSDAVEKCEKLLKRKIPIEVAAPGQPIPTLPEALWEAFASFDMFDSPIEMFQLAAEFNIKLTSMKDFMERFLNVH